MSIADTALDALVTEEVVIEPRPVFTFGLRELWAYRELLYFLTWRDIKVRYKQTALGAAWAVLQPVLTMVVFTIFFGRLAKIPSDGIPYPVFAFCALLPWQLFAFSLSESANSIVASKNLISKVYFPRLAVPLSAVLAGLVDFCIAFIVLVLLMLGYHIIPTSVVWTLPLFVIFAVITALSVGLWLSALNVEYRDVRYVIPFLTQFWMFATPIAYPLSIVPQKWRALYGLNPMVGVVEGFRYALLGRPYLEIGTVAVSAAMVAVLFISGVYYFRKMERTFADLI